jgi:ankyrin repeat protein
MVAAVTGHVDVLQKLIDNGADLSIVNGWGNTALMLSSIGRIRQDVVKVLLKAMYGPDYPQAFVALEIAKARSSEDLMSLMNVTGLLQPSQGSSEASLRETVYIEVIGQILRQGGPLLRSHILSSLMSTALYEPDTTMVKALFKNGFGSKQLIVTGQTPLYVAISRQHLGLIDALLQGGADPAMFSSVGARFTPLHLALRIFDNTKWKDTSIITSLLETGRCKLMKGADIHATAFSYALTHFDPWPSHLGRNLIFRMLESIEDIQEDRSDDGSTLMHAAVYHGREDLIAVLRSRGADIDAVDNAGCTPFYLECKRSTELLTSLWMRHANERHIGPDGQSALHMAVSGGRMDVIDYLLDLDLYIDHVDDNGYTPFAWAMILGQEDAALHLLSRGATLPTNKFRRGRQLLHISSSQGMLRITKRLLAGKFDIDARDDMGWTPLALACRKGSPELISVLLNAWANPEASPNNTFDRPLHLALRADNVEQADSAEVARVLIERGGADINARGEQGQTPLHLVAQLGDINLFQLLIDDYCEVQTLDDSGRTALHLCSHPDIASSLITHRCDPNHPDTNGWTPAHYAVASENLPVLRVLLLNGADPYARTKDDGLNVMERIEEVLDGEIKREMEEATKAIKLERKGC